MRRAARLGALGMTAAVALVALGGSPAAAQAGWASFSVVAEADGVHVALRIPGGPLSDDVLDAGAPRSQALLDSLGSSTAYAAAPWPGEVVANATGLASGPTGLALPTYPLIASSTHPTKDKDAATYGPIALTATSVATGSTSGGRMATAGGGQVDTSAAVTERADGLLSAVATTIVDNLTVGPLILGRVESRASASRGLDGKLARQTTTTVTGASVAGQAVELTEDGISVGGTGVPVSPSHPALKPLSDAGVVISWVGAQETADGIVSPAIEVTVTQPVSLTGQGSSRVRYTVGRASVRVAVSGAPARSRRTAPQPAPQPVPDSSAFDPGPAGSPTFVAGPLAPVAPLVPAPAPAPPPAPVSRPVSAARTAEEWPTFYLPLVVAALLTIGGAAAMRTWGVRNVWAS